MSRCLATEPMARFSCELLAQPFITLRDSGLSHMQDVAVQSLLSDLVKSA